MVTETGHISGITFDLKKITYEMIDGLAIFEGDIIVGTVEEMRAFTRAVETGQPAVVITGQRFRWPSGLVPFEIDPNLPNPERITGDPTTNVRGAIPHWESRTTIRFIRRTNQNSSQFPNFVVFSSHPEPNSCSSWIGMQGIGRQDILLGRDCDEATAIHEIGHTVGLWHEQSREDRDKFVWIHRDRVIPDKLLNFDPKITDGDDVGLYDYCSIMHYPANAFCISPCPGPTVEVLHPSLPCGTLIGLGNSLSNGDVEAINHMYGDRLLPRYQRKLFTIPNIVGVSGFHNSINRITNIIAGTTDRMILHNNQPLFQYGSSRIVSVSGFYNSDDKRHIVIVGLENGDVRDIHWRLDEEPVEEPLFSYTPGTIVSVSGYYNSDDKRHIVIVGLANGELHEIYWKSDTVGIEQEDPLPVQYTPGTIVSVSGFYNSDDKRHNVIVGTTNGTVHRLFWRSGTVGVEGNVPLPVQLSIGSITGVAGSSGDQIDNVILGTSDGKLLDLYWKSGEINVSGPYVLTPFPAKNIGGLAEFYNSDIKRHVVVVSTSDGGIHDLW